MEVGRYIIGIIVTDKTILNGWKESPEHKTEQKNSREELQFRAVGTGSGRGWRDPGLKPSSP
jgi:hypothetical protein